MTCSPAAPAATRSASDRSDRLSRRVADQPRGGSAAGSVNTQAILVLLDVPQPPALRLTVQPSEWAHVLEDLGQGRSSWSGAPTSDTRVLLQIAQQIGTAQPGDIQSTRWPYTR